MAALGAGLGMLVGAVAVVIALWELPRFRPHAFGDIAFVFAVAMALGGFAGYSLVALLGGS